MPKGSKAPANTETKTAAKTVKAKGGDKERKGRSRRRHETFSLYIYKVLKQVI